MKGWLRGLVQGSDARAQGAGAGASAAQPARAAALPAGRSAAPPARAPQDQPSTPPAEVALDESDPREAALAAALREARGNPAQARAAVVHFVSAWAPAAQVRRPGAACHRQLLGMTSHARGPACRAHIAVQRAPPLPAT